MNTKMNKVSQNQFSDIMKRIEKMSQKRDICVSINETVSASNDEMYNTIMSSSFKRISNSRESATKFLKNAGILDKKGNLTPEYK
jgi:hypothetical protein